MNQRKHVLPQLPENYIFYHRRAGGCVGDIGPIPGAPTRETSLPLASVCSPVEEKLKGIRRLGKEVKYHMNTWYTAGRWFPSCLHWPAPGETQSQWSERERPDALAAGL